MIAVEEGSDLEEETDSPRSPDVSQVDEAIREISETLKDWNVPAGPISIDGLRWSPHLIRDNSLLHVHLSEEMPRYISRRLVAASHTMGVCVALRLEGLYDENVLRVLADTDADVVVLVDGGSLKRSYYLAAMADHSVPVTPLMRTELAIQSWERMKDGDNVAKGRRLEGLLGFLLSQVAGFKVFNRNFRAATDEIDIVVQVDAFTSFCWSESGVPFVIVEAKNWSDTVGSNVVSLLIRKLDTRRRRARIGMLFATSGFSSDAKDEELKEARGGNCVVMFDGEAMKRWIDTQSPDEFLNQYVGEAMIR